MDEVLAGVFRSRLPNGITLLVERSPSAPVVGIVSCVRAGYLHEDDEVCGISHVLEHMIFNGSERFPTPSRFAREIRSLGAQVNASTSYDRTVYHMIVPRESFRRGLELGADALFRPVLDPDVMRREVSAVLEEEKRKRDTPSAFASEMWMSLAFTRHRLGRWRMGSPERLRAFTRADLERYLEGHYHPERLVLAVVGDVELGAARSAAEEVYGGFEKRTAPATGTGPPEPPQDSFRHRSLPAADLAQAYVVLGFHTPGVLTEESHALDVASFILGGGRSSRLYRRLRERTEGVNSADASSTQIGEEGIFHSMLAVDPASLERAEAVLAEELSRLAREPVADDELLRAARAIETGYHLVESEVRGRAMNLCHYEALGGVENAERYLEDLLAVGSDSIQEAAARYLRLENASLLEYVPEKAAGPGGTETKRSVLIALARTSAPALPVRAGAHAVAPRTEASTPPERVVLEHLSNGAPVVVIEDHRLPLVSFKIHFRGGRLEESRDEAGLTQLMARSSMKGAAGRSADAIAASFELLGTSLRVTVQEDSFGYGCTCLARYLDEALAITARLVREPDFSAAGVERERRDLLSALRRTEDHAFRFAFRLFREALFGEHPYGRPDEGAAEVLERIDRRELLRWHERTVRGDGLVIALAGDVSTARALELLERSFGSLPAGAERPVVPAAPRVEPGRVLVEERARNQTATVVGFPAAAFADPDRYRLEILQRMLGGLGGRLFQSIRGERGLAYSVSPFHYARLEAGAFAVFMATANDRAAEAERLLWQELERLRDAPPAPDELEQAKRSLAGSYLAGLQTLSARAAIHLQALIYNLPLRTVSDYPREIAACRPSDLLRVARRTLDPDRSAKGQIRGTRET